MVSVDRLAVAPSVRASDTVLSISEEPLPVAPRSVSVPAAVLVTLIACLAVAELPVMSRVAVTVISI